jgi:hypothetical protein
MPQQRFEDCGLTGCITSEKAADRFKAQANATPALQAQQQHEDQKTTQDIEAEKRESQKKQQNQQSPERKRKTTATARRGELAWSPIPKRGGEQDGGSSTFSKAGGPPADRRDCSREENRRPEEGCQEEGKKICKEEGPEETLGSDVSHRTIPGIVAQEVRSPFSGARKRRRHPCSKNHSQIPVLWAEEEQECEDPETTREVEAEKQKDKNNGARDDKPQPPRPPKEPKPRKK